MAVPGTAIGADADAKSNYARSKAEGEAGVREAFPGATILRPSIIFGAEDHFFNRFAALMRLGVIPEATCVACANLSLRTRELSAS